MATVSSRTETIQERPPLVEGEHLTRDEFERRYEAMPDSIKAELIEGVVYMSSPVRFEYHGEPHFRFGTWLGIYSANTPRVRGGISTSVRLDMDNEPQPDGLLFMETQLGGRAFVDSDGYVAGSPELAAEISAASTHVDLQEKFKVYRRNEIREYIIWRVLHGVIDWYTLRQSKYEPLAPSPRGFFQSDVFPGLWLDPKALISGDMARVQEVLQEGLKSPEHAAFVGRLQQTR